ncbi:MAG: hypothetical protein QGG64_07925, partial [Candidatus Latescibacteria bacterium]|nr:hypothetical protein [Candidatus Latescibacterota bacterium]
MFSKIRISNFVLSICLLILVSNAEAKDPTLARLYFEVPPERMAEFEVAYRTQLLPVLKKYGMEESTLRGRETPDHIFSRLFEFENPEVFYLKYLEM